MNTWHDYESWMESQKGREKCPVCFGVNWIVSEAVCCCVGPPCSGWVPCPTCNRGEGATQHPNLELLEGLPFAPKGRGK